MEVDEMKEEQTVFSLSGRFTARYIFQRGADQKRLFLLLHGFSDSGESLIKRLRPTLPEDAMILAPNGPFPVPQSNGESRSFGFSWYFYESSTDEYYVDMGLATEYLLSLIEEIGMATIPKWIIGYSQGGYLAPFVAQALKNVQRTIGINCQFLDEELMDPLPHHMEAINGADDEIVDLKRCQVSFAALLKRGVRGQLRAVPGAGHGLSATILEELGKLLEA